MSDPASDRLDSWKEIAHHLGRDVRTVRRWERERGLPVHRVPGGGRAAVYAFRGEIDLWLGDSYVQGRESHLDGGGTDPGPPTVALPVSKAWYLERRGRAAVVALVIAIAATTTWLLVSRPNEQRPELIDVSFYRGQGRSLGFHLDGLGFGNPTFRPPATRTVSYFRIVDVSCFAENIGHCEAGYDGDDYKLTYTSWADSQIVIDNYTVAAPGDAVELAVWKIGSGDPQDAVVWGGNIPPLKPGTPHIGNVVFSGAGKNLHITVQGSGFGDAPPGVPQTGDTAFFEFGDFAYHSPSRSKLSAYFKAGYNGENGYIDTVTLAYSSWTDTNILITGFAGNYGYNGLEVRSGDPVAIDLWSTKTRLATVWGGRVP